jgi:hypothetical protein
MGAVALSQVVHHAQVHDCADATGAEDVLRLAPTHIDLVMDDVRRHAIEAAPVDADHRQLAV